MDELRDLADKLQDMAVMADRDAMGSAQLKDWSFYKGKQYAYESAASLVQSMIRGEEMAS